MAGPSRLRGLPVGFHAFVETKEWREDVPGQHAISPKEYSTPAGKLQTSVRLSDDGAHGNHIPFMDHNRAGAGICAGASIAGSPEVNAQAQTPDRVLAEAAWRAAFYRRFLFHGWRARSKT